MNNGTTTRDAGRNANIGRPLPAIGNGKTKNGDTPLTGISKCRNRDATPRGRPTRNAMGLGTGLPPGVGT